MVYTATHKEKSHQLYAFHLSDKRDIPKKTPVSALPYKKAGEESCNAIHTMQSKPCSPQDTICTAQFVRCSRTTPFILTVESTRTKSWKGITQPSPRDAIKRMQCGGSNCAAILDARTGHSRHMIPYPNQWTARDGIRGSYFIDLRSFSDRREEQ